MAGLRGRLVAVGLAATVAGGLMAASLSLTRASTGVERASCDDPAGDVRQVGAGAAPAPPASGTDLRTVQLESDGDRLAVRFVAADPVPADATELDAGIGLPVQWVLWLMDGDDPLYQLRAVLRADGWELIRDDLRDVPVVTGATPDLDGRELGFDADLADLPRLPSEFGWVALSTYGDPPVQDVCPNAATDSLAPDSQLRFPAGG